METLNVEALQEDMAHVDLLTRPRRHVKTKGVLEVLLVKKERLKLKMYQRESHPKPHFHVDYGRENHVAAYDIETGTRIEGSLDRKYDSVVSAWARRNRSVLLQIWTAVQSGASEVQFVRELGPMD